MRRLIGIALGGTLAMASMPIIANDSSADDSVSPIIVAEADDVWNEIEGNWKIVKGTVQEQWGELTDDDLDVIEGKREQLIGKIQKRYGIGADEATRQVDDWAASRSHGS